MSLPLTLYSLVTRMMQPLVRRKLMRRALAEPLYGEQMDERFGRYALPKPLLPRGRESPSAQLADARPLIWIHAVSLGETRAAAILLKELRLAMPTMRLLLTHGTATGRAEGEKLLVGDDIQVWQPWDTPAATRSFMNHFKPSMGLLMETEVWPNLIKSAEAASVPMLLVNARLSEKSLQQSQRWFSKSLASLAYQALAAVYAQTTDDAARLASAGAKVSGVFGNVKFDITPNHEQLLQATQLRQTLTKPVIVFASSREGEEALFLSAVQALPEASRASVQWLVVPRHPQRFDEVASLIQTAGFTVVRRGAFSARAELVEAKQVDKLRASGVDHAIWLGDSVGEMAFYYGLSSAALLGGSFAPLGGQNLIEALACGCPVVMGPHTFNFEEATRLAALSAVAFRAQTLESAIWQALELCRPDGFEPAKAVSFIAAHAGATAKTVAAIKTQLSCLRIT